ncbi:hypothetical protein BCF74_10381 [Knoellia remsis]|uniref:Lipoprotein n=1 Tax=Knoellia remsis TaxID=407159 RepID=A0A2T0UYA9_9MICO|nr:hypothetical protein [Knoellia remsis]PRY62874.1 hypothetical protein BCF74_10381 [Knoellia remsis]
MTRRTLTTTIAAAALVAGLTGCGVGSAVVGLHDAPAERKDVAPLNVDGAETVAARVLASASAARSATGAGAAKAQSAVLAGSALSQAQAATKVGSAPKAAPLSKGADPQVIAISQGQQFPRAILAATLDEASKTQTLHVLLSGKATEPFKVYASVDMLAGTSVPALGDLAAGAPLAKPTDKAGGTLAPQAALAAYAAAINYPKPTANKAVATKDAYATRLRTTAEAQAKALNGLATLTQVHTLDPKSVIAFRLADGGTVTFGQLARKDTITATAKAKELKIPAKYSKLVGKTTATKNIVINNLESIVMVVPPKGAARTVAADEQVVSGSAS